MDLLTLQHLKAGSSHVLLSLRCIVQINMRHDEISLLVCVCDQSENLESYIVPDSQLTFNRKN